MPTDPKQACVYARHLCEKAGVKFILGRPQGELEKLIIDKSSASKRVTGIKTRDGRTHSADLVVVACECELLGIEVEDMLSFASRRSLDFIRGSRSPSLRRSHNGHCDVYRHPRRSTRPSKAVPSRQLPRMAVLGGRRRRVRTARP